MKKIISIMLCVMICFIMTSCKEDVEKETEIVPLASNMRSICELATLKCYYHNVAKSFEKDAEKSWFGVVTKDKEFWIEYSGVVTIGVDVAKVRLDVDDDKVTITIPPAKVLDCKVDETSLNEDSFVKAIDSADISADDQTAAFAKAQQEMKEEAANDTTLLASAQDRAKKLLEDYIHNIEECVGKTYEITWVYVE